MKNIEVILIADVAGLGTAGDQVQTKPGYFRNFLAPNKLAAPSGSKEAREILEEMKSRREAKAKQTELKESKKIVLEEKRKVANERKKDLTKKK